MEIVVATTVYIVVILTALQVGLATTRLSENMTFQAVSYELTMLAIPGPAIAIALIVVALCVGFVLNWAWSQNAEKERLLLLGRSWSIDRSPNRAKSNNATC